MGGAHHVALTEVRSPRRSGLWWSEQPEAGEGRSDSRERMNAKPEVEVRVLWWGQGHGQIRKVQRAGFSGTIPGGL